eukprot:TRINITY_DN2093_c0_g1_i1.p1 TRINITY_DN2093_c0_g1~~TRINITY_DN2093_c0_g1_i1.p1  ORF type:complete len:1540 (+),score=646.40 TRINITY_DN2093_c0_g1_i1:54-4622(+)
MSAASTRLSRSGVGVAQRPPNGAPQQQQAPRAPPPRDRRNGGASPPQRSPTKARVRSPTTDGVAKSVVHVCVRFRPPADQSEDAQPLAYVSSGGSLAVTSAVSTASGSDTETRQYTNFAHVFGHDASENDVHSHVWPHTADKLAQGYNATVLCYGQTGSGKTHTINNLLPSMLQGCFELLQGAGASFKADVSFLQIHLDKVYDLLGGSRDSKLGQLVEWKGHSMAALPRPYTPVSDVGEALALVRKGAKWRATNAHALNDKSSRSHTLFFLRMTRQTARGPVPCVLTMVDLAGSERVNKTQTTGETFSEGCAINRALTTLSRVIEALGSDSGVVPYRDNVLTVYLNETLTNSYFALVCCCSSDGRDSDETRCTLQFGMAARKVQITRRSEQLLRLRQEDQEQRERFKRERREREEATQRELEALQAEAEKVQRETAAIETQAEDAKRRAHKEQQAADAAEARIEEVLAEALRKEEEVRAAIEQVAAAGTERAQLERRALEDEEAVEDARRFLQRQEKVARDLEGAVRRARVEEGEAAEAARVAAERSDELADQLAECASLEARAAEMGGRSSALREELAAEQRRVAAAAAAASRLRDEEQQHRRTAAREQQVLEALASERVDAEAQMQRTRERVAELRREAGEAERERAALERRHADASAEAARLSEEVAGVRSELLEAEQLVLALEGEAEQGEAAAEDARQRRESAEEEAQEQSASCESQLKALRAACDGLAAQCAARAEELQLLRSSVLECEAERSAESGVEQALAQRAVAAAERRSEAEAERKRMEAEYSRLLQAKESAAAELQTAESAAGTLRERELSAQGTADSAAAELAGLRRAAARSAECLSQTQQRLREVSAANERRRYRASQRRQRLQQAEMRAGAECDAEERRLVESVAALAAALDDVDGKASQAEARKAELEAELRAATARMEQIREDVCEVAASAAVERRLAGSAEREIESLREHLREAVEEETEMDEEVADAAARRQRHRQRRREARSVRAASVEGKRKALQILEDELSLAECGLASVVEQTEQLQTQAAEMEARAAVAGERRAAMLERLEQAEAARSSLEEQVEEAARAADEQRRLIAAEEEEHERVLSEVRSMLADAVRERDALEAETSDAERGTAEQRAALRELRKELDGHLRAVREASTEKELLHRRVEGKRSEMAAAELQREARQRRLEEVRGEAASTATRAEEEQRPVLADISRAEKDLAKTEASAEQLSEELESLRRQHQQAERQSEKVLQRSHDLAADCIQAMDGLCAVRTTIAEEREAAAAREQRVRELSRTNRSMEKRRVPGRIENTRLRQTHNSLLREARELKVAAGATREARKTARKLSKELQDLGAKREAMLGELQRRSAESRELRERLQRSSSDVARAKSELRRERIERAAETHRFNARIGNLSASVAAHIRRGDAARGDYDMLARRAEAIRRESDDERPAQNLSRQSSAISVSPHGNGGRRTSSLARSAPSRSPSPLARSDIDSSFGPHAVSRMASTDRSVDARRSRFAQPPPV